MLAFCNTADTLHRNNLTLRISFDEGKNWIKDFLIYGKTENEQSIDYAAYSDLVQIADKQIGVLYEKDNYTSIKFIAISFKWGYQNLLK